MLVLENYTAERMDKFLGAQAEIHGALVLHRDAKPRNMMVTNKGDPEKERVLWMDFDRAWTYDEETMPERDRKLLERE